MEAPNEPRHKQMLTVPAHTFSGRLDTLTQTQVGHSTSGSMYSRLALIHQAAKALAMEAVSAAGPMPIDLTVDELTDPPLYESGVDEEPVIIRFSYR